MFTVERTGVVLPCLIQRSKKILSFRFSIISITNSKLISCRTINQSWLQGVNRSFNLQFQYISCPIQSYISLASIVAWEENLKSWMLRSPAVAKSPTETWLKTHFTCHCQMTTHLRFHTLKSTTYSETIHFFSIYWTLLNKRNVLVNKWQVLLYSVFIWHGSWRTVACNWISLTSKKKVYSKPFFKFKAYQYIISKDF